jgi:hypothetical protein
MKRSFWIAPGAILTVGLVVCGLWGWQQAEAFVTLLGWEKRTIGAWSVRCAGAALISAAQAIAIALVVERVYRRDAVFAAVKLSAVMIYLLCSVCAIALGLAGR